MSDKDIRKHIKDSLKQDFKFDLVLTQIGFMFEAIEEDATFLCDNFDCQLQGSGKFVSYEITGFPASGLEKYKQDLDSMNIEYCIVEQMKDSLKGKKQRVVTFSTVSGAEGLMFH
jgi:DNA mismatch repair ATPase MutS|tara:strand:- start:50 stop:394 length:345 start_codon:yes stop_codon:yes gene_type:complete